MSNPRRHRIHEGQQPYDPLNGFRVGALAGGLSVTLATAGIGMASLWFTMAGAAVGGLIGFAVEKRRS